MKKYLLPVGFLLSFFPFYAQESVGTSIGSGYAEQSYYRLTDDAVFNIDNTAWDIAFTTFGTTDGGIHVNESAKTEFLPPIQPSVELYAAPTNDFADVINPDDLTTRLLNDEKSWLYGAVNNGHNENNPDDYGWGIFDDGANAVLGNKVFAIKLRSGQWKKFQVVSLQAGVYTLLYANPDGSDETTLSIDKANFTGGLAFFSFETGDLFDIDTPADWDIVFQRYITPIVDNNGDTIPFPVTGVLSAHGVEVAEAGGVDPVSAAFEDWQDSLSSVTDVIGYDWKSFDNGWTLRDDLAYFVKTTTGHLWKIVFTDFTGASSGTIIFDKYDIGGPIATSSTHTTLTGLKVSPNPAHREATAVFTLKKTVNDLRLSLHNTLGLEVWSSPPVSARKGLQAMTMRHLPDVPGTYILFINAGGEVTSQRVVLQ
ncbi:MAG TPA: T9SS type A sorting domain-containing protein [Bacteroidetes bacterium]|nr:T9SS type A sorting domain-containing protein [Bacteroidota bacterium]